MMSKNCPKCGTFLSDTDKFCPKCGWKNTSDNKKTIIIVVSIILVVLIVVGIFLGYKIMKKRDEIINERIKNSLNVLDEEESQDKETNEEYEQNIEENDKEYQNNEPQEEYNYLDECPCGELCIVYDNDLDNLKNSFYPNGGATVTVEEAMQGYVFNIKKEYKNGTLFNVESTDLSMGNYEFEVFVDNIDETINFINVLDRDNGKVYESWDSVNTYIQDVYNRLMGVV